MTSTMLTRWRWFIVATLAVAPVFAQTPQPAWTPTIPGPAAAALSLEAQAPDPASRVEIPAEIRQDADPLPAQTQPPLSTGSATAAQGTKIDEVAKGTTKKAAAKYDVTRIGSRTVDKGVNFYSLEKEQRLGRELAADLEQQVHLLDDPVVSEYVNRVAQNLVLHSDAKVPFTIRVVDDDEINAFALPGGYFYVNSGLLLAADNEAELAGVMAHEIAHVCARHATRNMTKGQIWNIASIPLIFVGGGAGYAIRQVVAVGVPMSFLKFSRDAEREADLLGLEYEYAAGYDPSAFVQFFEKIHARERREKHRLLSKMFSTHPMTEDRIRRAQEEMATMLPVRDQYVVTTSEFDDVKRRLAAVTIRLKNGTDERNVNRPTLRRRTPQSGDSGHDGRGVTQADGNDRDDHRPTLKRASD
jgi:predicted Zn-dependent protease